MNAFAAASFATSQCTHCW